MATGQRSLWPVLLLLGLCTSIVLGSAVAVADESDGGRPWWRDDDPQHLTGTIASVDAETSSVVLESVLAWQAEDPAIGTLTVVLDDLTDAAPDVTVDVVVTRDGGRWRSPEVLPLDTD